VGRISEIVRLNAGIFQKVSVTPYVDFEILEEVFIISEPVLKSSPGHHDLRLSSDHLPVPDHFSDDGSGWRRHGAPV
jgi:hypothetical protein